jgi:polysaccharide chain length determinant protein (PEP-CTERM system associated)
MTALIDQVLEAARSSWRFRWWGLLVAYAIAIPGWVYVFGLQDRYEASARIFVDTLTPLHPVLQGITVDQDVAAQLNFVRQSLLDGPQLEKIARDTGVLTAPTEQPRDKERALEDLQKRVGISVSSASPRDNDRAAAGSIYDITYRDSDRARCLRVVQALLTTLIEHTQGGKRASSESAQKFLEAQIREYESQLRAAEDRLAQFKQQNLGALPAEQGGYFAQLQAELTATDKAEAALSIALSRRAELQRQLRQAALIATTVATPVPGAPGTPGRLTGEDTVSRIKATQTELDELLLRFTEEHPDVVSARRKLHDLELRRATESEHLRRGDPNAIASSGASANPVYQSIQLALNNADLEIASLRTELEQHSARTKELREMLNTAPRVEADYATLTRDYEVNKAQYSALLANYAKARLSEQADSAGSVRFEIVQPPTASIQPVFPRRGPLMAAVLGAALLVGVALAYLLHLLRPVVGSGRALAALTGLPVFGIVGFAFPGQVSGATRTDVRRFAGIAAGLLIGLAMAVWLNRAGVRLSLTLVGL